MADGSQFSYFDWSQLIKDNFERCFWVPSNPSEDDNYEIEANYVARRGIYKDVFRSTHKYTDYQLRPNLCVAMSYAPEIFEQSHA